MQLVSSSKLPGQITLHLIFARYTGFQSMLESNSKSLLFASVQLLLLAVSTFLISSRSTGRVYLSHQFKIYWPCLPFSSVQDLLAVSTFLICSRSTGRVYLSDLCKIYSPSRRFRFSTDRSILCIPCWTPSVAAHIPCRTTLLPVKQREHAACLKQREHAACLKQREHAACLKQREHAACLKQREHAACLKQREHAACLKQREHAACLKQREHAAD